MITCYECSSLRNYYRKKEKTIKKNSHYTCIMLCVYNNSCFVLRVYYVTRARSKWFYIMRVNYKN